MAENTPVPPNRIERTLSFMIGGVGGLSVLAIIVLFLGGALGWWAGGAPAIVAALPLVGLPITLILIIAFVVLSSTRRRRIDRDGGR